MFILPSCGVDRDDMGGAYENVPLLKYQNKMAKRDCFNGSKFQFHNIILYQSSSG